MSFLDVLWLIFVTYLFFAYLMVLFSVVGDLFRDRETSGFVKAVWAIALVVLPFLSLVLYLIVRGQGMADRTASSVERQRTAQKAYVREVAGRTSPVEQVATARSLLDSGAITPQEFSQLKDKALAG